MAKVRRVAARGTAKGFHAPAFDVMAKGPCAADREMGKAFRGADREMARVAFVAVPAMQASALSALNLRSISVSMSRGR